MSAAVAARYAGCRSAARNRQTGTLILILDGVESGIEDDPEARWVTLCEDHDRLVCHPTLALARENATDPKGWCGVCAGTEPPEDLDPEDGLRAEVWS